MAVRDDNANSESVEGEQRATSKCQPAANQPLEDYYRLALSICSTWSLFLQFPSFEQLKHLKVTTSSKWLSLPSVQALILRLCTRQESPNPSVRCALRVRSKLHLFCILILTPAVSYLCLLQIACKFHQYRF